VTILLGMNNPVSTKPGHELYPWPEGCTGYRLHAMLSELDPAITRSAYLRMFDRRNLLRGPWTAEGGRRVAARLRGELESRRDLNVVVLGADVWRALGLDRRTELLSHCQELTGPVWWRVPHPSGRNLWYNAECNRVRVARLLLQLLEEERK
jgi:hypothetical protein